MLIGRTSPCMRSCNYPLSQPPGGRRVSMGSVSCTAAGWRELRRSISTASKPELDTVQQHQLRPTTFAVSAVFLLDYCYFGPVHLRCKTSRTTVLPSVHDLCRVCGLYYAQ